MGARRVDVASLKGRRTQAEVVAQDYEVGLAVLRVKRQGLPAAPLGRTEPPGARRPGDRHRVVRRAGGARRAAGIVTYLGEFEAYWEYLLDRGIVSSARQSRLRRRRRSSP